MNSFTDRLLRSIIDFVIKSRTETIKYNHQFPFGIPSILDPIKQHMQSQLVSSFLQRMCGKVPDDKPLPYTNVQIIFKLTSTQNKLVVYTQIWEVQLKNIQSYQNSLDEKQVLFLLKQLFQNILQLSYSLFKNNNLKNLRNKSAPGHLLFTYQIDYAMRSCTLGLTKTEIQQKMNKSLMILRIYSSNSKNQQLRQKVVADHNNSMRKQSISTIDSNSDNDFSPQMRRKSLYSYYDAESEITILLNQKQDLGEDINMETHQFQEQEEEGFQTILSEEDEKLKLFQQILRQLIYSEQSELINYN